MNTKSMEQFKQMDVEMLASVDGGKNNWQNNVLEGVGAALLLGGG
ncbi:Blp family class II bacteriocin [Streptococcus sp. VTCC 12886]